MDFTRGFMDLILTTTETVLLATENGSLEDTQINIVDYRESTAGTALHIASAIKRRPGRNDP